MGYGPANASKSLPPVIRYRLLPIEPEHAAAVEDLPAHHADPFDRIMVAQTLVEPMRLMTLQPTGSPVQRHHPRNLKPVALSLTERRAGLKLQKK